jgi:hypothetical protein
MTKKGTGCFPGPLARRWLLSCAGKVACPLFLLAACKSAPQARDVSEDVRVEGIALDLHPEGKGTIGFALDLEARPGESCTVTRVEWELMLSERAFASGVASANVLVPGGQHAQVKIEEPVAFGGMGYDGRPRTVMVSLRGEVVTQWRWGEERKRFSHRTRVAVRGAPVYDR